MNRFVVGAVLTGFTLLGGVVAAFSSIEVVEPGNVGLVYTPSGGLQKETLSQGWHLVSPFAKVTKYPISTTSVQLSKKSEDGDQSLNVSTSEGKLVNSDIQYNFHIDPEKAPVLFTKFKGASIETIEAGYLRQNLKASIQEITSTYGVLDIYGSKRDEITAKVSENFTKKMKADGFIIENFSFVEIRPDAQSMKAIQAKVDAQQKLIQFETEKKQAEVLAQKSVIEAKGKADAALIEAQGKAKANAALQQSITPELIEYEKAKKWDGKLPQVSGGNTPMIQMSTK